MKNLWVCPKCGRQFEKRKQGHSCKVYPLEKHFAGKEEISRPLYEELKKKFEKETGPFRVESLPCCIHFVKAPAYTFAGIFALKNRIRIHFSLNYKLENPRLGKFTQMSAHRWLYSVDIGKKEEMDKELIGWLKQAYEGKK
jgi:hypothetical protein